MSWKAKLALAALLAAPAVVLRLAGVVLTDPLALLVFGGGVVAAACILAWAAEAAEVDIAGSLAVALLALIAVLPEFAVDLYFAFTAGHRPSYAAYAAANMTGSNRLLIGFGWSLAAIVFIVGARRRGFRRRDGGPVDHVILKREHRIELGFLGLASIYAVVIPLTRRIAWYDAIVLIGLFFAYMWRVGQAERGAPDLIGVSAAVAGLPTWRRRTVVVLLFLFAAAVVLAAARPFAEALIGTGRDLGIDEFLLVQWLAPLASEAPELVVASLFAWRGSGSKAVGTLLSAEVNQWTLLVGALPIAYLVGGGGWGLPLDHRQNAEFVLTSAQAVLGFAVLANLRFHAWEALVMLGLFAAQFALPNPTARLWLAGVYLAIGAVILVAERRHYPPIARMVMRRDAEQEEEDEQPEAAVP
ncbi:MAG TPA: sodium:proton exchanger [Actinomycetes bacterium]|nr:sodium:proton exchanger [Actinomycetes bacterium]